MPTRTDAPRNPAVPRRPPTTAARSRSRQEATEAKAARPPRRGRTRSWTWWLRRATYVVVLFAIAGVGVVFYLLDSINLPKAAAPVETSFICLGGVAPGACGPDNSVAALSAQENRTTLTYDQIPKVMVRAVVAAEDRDFFEHNGIDPFGIARALYRDLSNTSQARQGGSTITQQYVKLTYLSSERTLTRKLKEAALAVKLERRYTKQQILERYLNEVYFGRGAYGVEAAARVYFDIPSRQLTVDQAALLAALIRSPLDDPSLHPAEALQRRNGVIDAMVSTGYVTEADGRAARNRPIASSLVEKVANAKNLRVESGFASIGGEYISEWVRQQLTAMFGEGAAYTKGLRVYLTIDPAAQINAHEAITKNLDQPTDPASALVSVDENGRIVAMVGGEDYATSQVNYALGTAGGGSGRAAGSTFKAFALAAFVEQGNSVKSVYTAPKELVLPKADQGKDWPVTNFEDEDLGTVTVEEATWHSANTVYAQIMQQVGSKAVAEMATRLGVTAPVNPVNSVVLGTADVSVLDMATAYSTFANHGVKIQPYLIQRVETHGGKVLFDAGTPTKTQVISPEVADTVTNVLKGVISKGTGTKALLKKVAAGKTGTTNDNKDAWFVGYTCHVTTAVWVGYDTPRPMLNVHNVPAVTGGTFPANIWRSFMSKETADESKCTYRNIDAGTNKLNPLLVPGPPTTTTVPPPVVPPAGGATTATTAPVSGSPVATTAPPATPAGTPPSGQAATGGPTG